MKEMSTKILYHEEKCLEKLFCTEMGKCTVQS